MMPEHVLMGHWNALQRTNPGRPLLRVLTGGSMQAAPVVPLPGDPRKQARVRTIAGLTLTASIPASWDSTEAQALFAARDMVNLSDGVVHHDLHTPQTLFAVAAASTRSSCKIGCGHPHCYRGGPLTIWHSISLVLRRC